MKHLAKSAGPAGKKTVDEIRQQAFKDVRPLVKQLVTEGVDKNRIVQTVKRYVESCVNSRKGYGLKRLRPPGLMKDWAKRTDESEET